ncbi:MAG: histidinol-phosphatase HisJ family protein [bacterium]
MPSDYPELTPLTQISLADYHCHCDYSIDAIGSIDDYCRAALQLGLVEICFTTHFDTNPAAGSGDCFIRIDGEKRPATPDNFEVYVDHVHRAHEEFYPRGLSVKLGVEIGWWPGCLESVSGLLDRFDLDHVLCGIHEIYDRCICFDRFSQSFAHLTVDQFCREYFHQVKTAVHSGLFDAIAHLDYYVRFGHKHYGPVIHKAYAPYLNELFDSLKATDTALEINTSAIRHGFHQYYPSMAILNSARRAGAALRFLGSDAHRPEQVGLDFDAAAVLIPDRIVSREG